MPEEPPQNVQCSPLTSESLRMSWDPPPMQSHHGTILGYKIHYKKVNPKSGRKEIMSIIIGNCGETQFLTVFIHKQ